MKLAARRTQVLALVESRPEGISAVDIGDAICLGYWRTKDVVRSLRNDGFVACVKPGRVSKWATTERAAVLRLLSPPAPPRKKPAPVEPVNWPVIRPAGTWERASVPSLLRPAGVFDGLHA